MSVFNKLMRAGEGKILRKLHRIADQVNSIEEDFVNLSDAELRALTDEYKQRYADGESLDDLLPEAFATVREAAKRVLGQRHYDVQMLGGAALHLGYVAEMKTGEGKTLVGTLPAYLNALSGKGVHLITVNDYLAERDSEMMGRVHKFLGLEVGCIIANMTPAQRREQYACDITYGTNNEFGFDYLRDNMAWSQDELVQRGHNYAIVDEVDSILVDEARTPLIISGPADQATKWYGDFAKLVTRLTKGEAGNQLKGIEETGDYEVDEKKRTVAIHEPGVAKVEDWLGIDNLYESVNTPLVGYLNNAIKAKELFKNDKDYVVIDGEVMIVDEHTGRILAGRRYNEGMHQAIEAKEGVDIKDENQTLATITLQNFFRLYGKLSGMTGTAMTEAAEFHQIYKLGVVPIPTNKPMVRMDQSDLIYRTEVAKFDAVVEDIAEKHEKGQPILVGTTSVEKSEYLSQLGCPSAGCSTRCSTPSSTTVRRRSSPRPAARVPSPSPRTWPAVVRTSSSAATRTTSPRRSCASAASIRTRTSRSGPPRCPPRWRTPSGRSRPSTTRSRTSAGCTCWVPSGTSRAVSTTSCVVVPDARVTRASPVSTSRSVTT